MSSRWAHPLGLVGKGATLKCKAQGDGPVALV